MTLRNKIYYHVKPLIPRQTQILLRRNIVFLKKHFHQHNWPIDENSNNKSAGWAGWPDDKKFALVLTHDVDTAKGRDKCLRLMEIEENLGFRSSFNFVPERYNDSPRLRHYLTRNGFEVGVHDLNHDGKLYDSRRIFEEKAVQINKYLEDWNCAGFRSGAMHHNLDWLHRLNIEYDASTFDTDPFEPQPDGMATIFPFWVQNAHRGNGYVELPYTIPQDFTLFILMKEKTIDIWKRKLDWIAEHGGMALLITHPDYMNFEETRPAYDEYPIRHYIEYLLYIKRKYHGQYWHALPRNVAFYYKHAIMAQA